ncbi:glycosyltransferase family 2 protein [Paenibacillus alkalitolerans]|uniref:glycosyltransferase family 2 protein n=1 Tax=Paenibacillus alkalitolerans TaxID=2799335 RepID=UPI0018F39522|nr:glycosyltransferase family 2 protein [Paenibacillus alkalitolerans]
MIVIPMVGKSSRFFTAGYNIPKFMLPIQDRTVFSHAILSFEKYFSDEEFLFLTRNDYNAEEFVTNEVNRLGIKNYTVKVFEKETNGQAETVFLGLHDINRQEEVFIFNIDTFLLNFEKPQWIEECDGYLEVFIGEGENWSYVRSGINNSVIETAEKEKISNLCCDGLYYFKEKALFDQAYYYFEKNNMKIKDEYFIAPLYNVLINIGLDIRYSVINENEVIICGTPEEYEKCIATNLEQRRLIKK